MRKLYMTLEEIEETRKDLEAVRPLLSEGCGANVAATFVSTLYRVLAALESKNDLVEKLQNDIKTLIKCYAVSNNMIFEHEATSANGPVFIQCTNAACSTNTQVIIETNDEFYSFG